MEKVRYNSYVVKNLVTILGKIIFQIFSTIFKGNGIEFDKKDNEIYPLINVPLDWINSFLEMDDKSKIINENNDELASSFMEFLEGVAPQYRENVLKASEYIEKKL